MTVLYYVALSNTFGVRATSCNLGELNYHHRYPLIIYRVVQKSKLLILSEYVNKTQKIGGM